ncbi:hypothetical protein CYLTODRAFT_447378 [Cylindrobasidium torrendii FP15055 ss-10]|uniref:Uncharacterized protein n=1 Tax=Cylindrobasidium torrendii FP15055 ss-10 TaxID=1314674 RepID=A0A0D7AXY2_9AGAR|nr:hypothetical protein CYLTODRAFT_447378 [Cylindrobasidium torrendii FP15055 ss-10]
MVNPEVTRQEARLNAQLDSLHVPFIDTHTGLPLYLFAPTTTVRARSLFDYAWGKRMSRPQHLQLYHDLCMEVMAAPAMGMIEDSIWPTMPKHTKANKYAAEPPLKRMADAPSMWDALKNRTKSMDYFNDMQQQYGWSDGITAYRKVIDDMRMLILHAYPTYFLPAPSSDALDDALDVALSWWTAIASGMQQDGRWPHNRAACAAIPNVDPYTDESLDLPGVLRAFEDGFSRVFPEYDLFLRTVNTRTTRQMEMWMEDPPYHGESEKVLRWMDLHDWIGEVATLAMDRMLFPPVRMQASAVGWETTMETRSRSPPDEPPNLAPAHLPTWTTQQPGIWQTNAHALGQAGPSNGGLHTRSEAFGTNHWDVTQQQYSLAQDPMPAWGHYSTMPDANWSMSESDWDSVVTGMQSANTGSAASGSGSSWNNSGMGYSGWT